MKLAKDAHLMRKLLRLKLKGTLCLFHHAGQGAFFTTECNVQSKDVVIGQFEPHDLRQIENLHQRVCNEQHADLVKRQKLEWYGYNDKRLH